MLVFPSSNVPSFILERHSLIHCRTTGMSTIYLFPLLSSSACAYENYGCLHAAESSWLPFLALHPLWSELPILYPIVTTPLVTGCPRIAHVRNKSDVLALPHLFSKQTFEVVFPNAIARPLREHTINAQSLYMTTVGRCSSNDPGATFWQDRPGGSSSRSSTLFTIPSTLAQSWCTTNVLHLPPLECIQHSQKGLTIFISRPG